MTSVPMSQTDDGLVVYFTDASMSLGLNKLTASRDIIVKFTDNALDVVDQYKYLGN